MHTIAVAVTEGVPPFELAAPCEVFGIDRTDLASPWYHFMLCAATPPPVRTGAGLVLDTPYGLDDLAKADTVIVPAGTAIRDAPPPELVEALRVARERGARIASICAGAFVLAAAGLLDGRRATMHWMYAHVLAERYPEVTVDPNVLYVDEGDVLTSAGTAAGVDLCLHIVRRDCGAVVANAIARRIVLPPHRDGGQAQYVELPVPQADGNGLGGVLDWALERLDEPLTVEDMARHAGTSARTVTRRFRDTTGLSPLQWLLQQRVRLAQQLLESTDEPVERIARRCGFATAASLRQHFVRDTGVTPSDYRRTFRGAPNQWTDQLYGFDGDSSRRPTRVRR